MVTYFFSLKLTLFLVEFLVVSVVSCLLFYYYFFFYGFYSVMYVRYIYNYILTIVLKVLLCARQPLQFSVSILPYVYMYNRAKWVPIAPRSTCLATFLYLLDASLESSGRTDMVRLFIYWLKDNGSLWRGRGSFAFVSSTAFIWSAASGWLGTGEVETLNLGSFGGGNF